MVQDLENEIWRPIRDYEGLYEVSNKGRLKTLKRVVYKQDGRVHYIRKERLMRPVITNRGYYKIMLCKNSITKQFSVHRLVAEAFLENPNNLPQVNHKDENKLNNCVENLEYCDLIYNINYGTGIERRAEKRRKRI